MSFRGVFHHLRNAYQVVSITFPYAKPWFWSGLVLGRSRVPTKKTKPPDRSTGSVTGALRPRPRPILLPHRVIKADSSLRVHPRWGLFPGPTGKATRPHLRLKTQIVCGRSQACLQSPRFGKVLFFQIGIFRKHVQMLHVFFLVIIIHVTIFFESYNVEGNIPIYIPIVVEFWICLRPKVSACSNNKVLFSTLHTCAVDGR